MGISKSVYDWKITRLCLLNFQKTFPYPWTVSKKSWTHVTFATHSGLLNRSVHFTSKSFNNSVFPQTHLLVNHTNILCFSFTFLFFFLLVGRGCKTINKSTKWTGPLTSRDDWRIIINGNNCHYLHCESISYHLRWFQQFVSFCILFISIWLKTHN